MEPSISLKAKSSALPGDILVQGSLAFQLASPLGTLDGQSLKPSSFALSYVAQVIDDMLEVAS